MNRLQAHMFRRKIPWASHNALLLMGYFIQLVMSVNSCETHKSEVIPILYKYVLSLFIHMTTCTKYPDGSNSLWEVLGTFSLRKFKMWCLWMKVYVSKCFVKIFHKIPLASCIGFYHKLYTEHHENWELPADWLKVIFYHILSQSDKA